MEFAVKTTQLAKVFFRQGGLKRLQFGCGAGNGLWPSRTQRSRENHSVQASAGITETCDGKGRSTGNGQREG